MGASSADGWLARLLGALWRVAALACCGLSGVMADQSLTPVNISAVPGLMVTLRCELTATNVSVSLVVWSQCGKPKIAVYSPTEGMVLEPFTERFTLAEGYGITIQSAQYNDTGEYCCLFQTFPDGRYDGRIFLEVKAPSALSNVQLALVTCLPLGVLLALVLVTVGIYSLKLRRRAQCHTTPCANNHYSLTEEPENSLPGTAVEGAVSRPAVVHDSDYFENHGYFNVIQYGCVNHCKMGATTCKNTNVLKLERKEIP